jgi:hypothetical protein
MLRRAGGGRLRFRRPRARKTCSKSACLRLVLALEGVECLMN